MESLPRGVIVALPERHHGHLLRAPVTPFEFTNGRFSNSAVDIILTTGCGRTLATSKSAAQPALACAAEARCASATMPQVCRVEVYPETLRISVGALRTCDFASRTERT
jgi:hypothetical protein